MDTVDKFTFAELQGLDAGSWFNIRFPDRARPTFKNVRILRLEDVINIAEGGSQKPGLYIETKSARRFPGIEGQLAEILTARGWIKPQHNDFSEFPAAKRARVRARVIFQSFEPESLARLKELAPQVPAVLLIDETMPSNSPGRKRRPPSPPMNDSKTGGRSIRLYRAAAISLNKMPPLPTEMF